jgi:1,4-dihydroxy-2-naphthoate octaprenyltransferase
MNDSRLAVWFEAVRPRTLPASVAPVVVGSAVAWRDGAFDAAAAALCLGFAVLVQIGTNFANDTNDFRRGADTGARVGPRRVVAAGLISLGAMQRATVVAFAAAFLVGLGLIAWGGPILIVVGLASIAAGYAYTGGPWPLGYHGLGDLFVFIFFGLVAVTMTYYVQAGYFAADALLAAVPIGLLTANILVVNNYRDADTDKAAGKRTLVVRWGRGAAKLQFGFSLLVAAMVPAIFAARISSPLPLVPLVLVPRGLIHLRRLNPNATPQQLIVLLGDTGKLLAAYAVLLALGIAL